jgi:hypothetical protein
MILIKNELKQGIIVTMKKNLYLFCLFISILYQPNLSNANQMDPGFDKPLHVEKFNMGRSKDADSNIIKTCYIYSKFIVTEFNDPALKGNAKIGIDILDSKQTNYLNICKKNFRKFAYKLIPEGYFNGKIDNYIITKGSDSFGIEYAFQVFKLSNKKKKLIFEGIQGIDHPFQFIRNKEDSLGIKYWTSLHNRSHCSLFDNEKKDSCWDKILKDNNINYTIRLQDCIKSVKKIYPKINQSELEKSAIQSLIYIEIPDLRYPKNIKLLDKSPRCYITP